MRIRILLSIILLTLFPVIKMLGQENHDSLHTQQVPEITVRAYFHEQPLLALPASVSVVDSNQLKRNPTQSMVSVMNTMPGVRMEERSPGSYRISIRGSVLRSPFGVRNVKVYLDDISLTDGGGNTYINLLDAASINKIEVLKGPEGSIFGANTGGVILIDPIQQHADSLSFNGSYEGGSFGYAHEKESFQKIWKNNLFSITQGFQRSDGYRQNSKMMQNYVQLYDRWQYSEKAQLKFYFLFSDLRYSTPGGLTQAQYDVSPSDARHGTATLPSAVDQKAAIVNTSFLGGITHEVQIKYNLRHVLAISGSHTAFANPFITNFEVRNENNFGVRTYFDWSNHTVKKVNWHWQNGAEVQQIFSKVSNYGNRAGEKDTLQAADNFNAGQYFLFSHFSINIARRLTIEAALSLNYYQYNYKYLYPVAADGYTRQSFNPQLMLRVAASYLITDYFAWRASLSRGYSPPTLAEIHPSDKAISTNLQPESGWNYETGFRLHDKHDRIWIDATAFYYQLQNAIVIRSDSAGNNYFVNAGGTQQAGLETQLIAWLVKPKDKGFVRSLEFRNSYTFSHYLFRNYQSDGNDLSGNYLTGVPKHVVVSSLDLTMALGFYLYLQHNFTDHIPLNDANSVYANHYNLLQTKIGWKKDLPRHVGLEIYMGINNMLNEKYSLGNDLNAVGGRYFNAAPPVNYYAGLAIRYSK